MSSSSIPAIAEPTGGGKGLPTKIVLPKSPVSASRWPVAIAEALGVVTVG